MARRRTLGSLRGSSGGWHDDGGCVRTGARGVAHHALLDASETAVVADVVVVGDVAVLVGAAGADDGGAAAGEVVVDVPGSGGGERGLPGRRADEAEACSRHPRTNRRTCRRHEPPVAQPWAAAAGVHVEVRSNGRV